MFSWSVTVVKSVGCQRVNRFSPSITKDAQEDTRGHQIKPQRVVSFGRCLINGRSGIWWKIHNWTHERKELLVLQSHRLSIIDSVGLSPMNNYRLAVCNRTVSKESAVCSRGKASWLSWLRKSRMHVYVDADSDAGIFIIIMYMRT